VHNIALRSFVCQDIENWEKYEVCWKVGAEALPEHVSRKRGLVRTYYANLTQRIRSLVADGDVIELQPKKAQGQ